MTESQTSCDQADERAVNPERQTQVHEECMHSVCTASGEPISASGDGMHSEAESSSASGYKPEQVAEKLGVAKRTVYKYAKDIISIWHWLPESVFRKDGIYSEFAIGEMIRLKRLGLEAYQQEVHYENASVLPSPPTRELTQVEICDDKLNLPSNIVTPIEGSDRLSLARHNLSENQQALNSKLANIQTLLNEHQRQQADSKQGFAINMENRKAQLLLQVAQQALQDKLEADRLYDAILSGNLNGFTE